MAVGLPCKNPNCKSVGKPHPNCKCYQGMAEGGEVEDFCSSGQEHDPFCPFSSQMDPADSVSAYLIHEGFSGLLNKKLNSDMDQYHNSIAKGHKKLDKNAQSLFANESLPELDNEKSKKTINEWMDKGSTYEDIQTALSGYNDPKNPIQSDIMSEVHPEQNLMLQTSKGNASAYLNSLKPQSNSPKLAFDSEPDLSSSKKTYNKALEIASNPLSILKDVQDGTIEAENVKHLTSMYPEVYEMLQKKLTEGIIKAQLKGEKPSMKVRQGLSLLMGVPLSSEFTPQNMMAIQATFTRNQSEEAQEQTQSKPKSSTSKLSKSDQSFLTSNQSLVKRQQRSS